MGNRIQIWKRKRSVNSPSQSSDQWRTKQTNSRDRSERREKISRRRRFLRRRCSTCSKETITFELNPTPSFPSGRYYSLSLEFQVISDSWGLWFRSIFHSAETLSGITRIPVEFERFLLEIDLKMPFFSVLTLFSNVSLFDLRRFCVIFIFDSRVLPDPCFCVNPLRKMQNYGGI